MIDAATGEVRFSGGVGIVPHMPVSAFDLKPSFTRNLPVQGWRQHSLGLRGSEFGRFQVEITTDPEQRIEAAFLRHIHSFYLLHSPADAERRIFHEGIIAEDLRGQREFSWGHVFCRLDENDQRDWLCLIYTPFSSVPLREKAILQALSEYAPFPTNT